MMEAFGFRCHVILSRFLRNNYLFYASCTGRLVKNHKEFKRKLGLNKCRILFFGGIAKIKGFIYFLNVFCVVMKLIRVRSFQRHVNEGFDQKYENYF